MEWEIDQQPRDPTGGNRLQRSRGAWRRWYRARQLIDAPDTMIHIKTTAVSARGPAQRRPQRGGRAGVFFSLQAYQFTVYPRG